VKIAYGSFPPIADIANMADAAIMATVLEPVHTVNQYYDGPELGVADFEGRPHVFERVTECHDGKPDIYRLGPIDRGPLNAVLEDWQLFLKWEAAHDDPSRQGLGSGPRVLPEDLARHLELKPIIETALKVDEAHAVQASGTFLDGMTKVKWEPI
jgi:hypothetical protein